MGVIVGLVEWLRGESRYSDNVVPIQPEAGFAAEDQADRINTFYKFGWVPFFPLILAITAILKSKNRKLATDDKYLEHQIEFFSFFKGIQSRLGLQDLIGTDKFHKLRPLVAQYALYGLEGRSHRMLDVATGYGFQAEALKESGVNQVEAIDIVPERIRGAIQLHGHTGINFHLMDAARLRFPDDQFDSTVVSAALHDMPKRIKRSVLEEMIRVTKPEGNIVILEPRTFKNRWIGFILGTVGELLDESLNIREFVMDDLNTILQELDLDIIKDENHCQVLNIKLCRVKR